MLNFSLECYMILSKGSKIVIKKKKKKKERVHTEFLLSVIGNIECEIHYPGIFIIKEFNLDSVRT